METKSTNIDHPYWQENCSNRNGVNAFSNKGSNESRSTHYLNKPELINEEHRSLHRHCMWEEGIGIALER